MGPSKWLTSRLNDVNENSDSLFSTKGLGDFLVHHAMPLGLRFLLTKQIKKYI